MKAIAKLFATLIKTALILLMLAHLVPILYFAWRMNQLSAIHGLAADGTRGIGSQLSGYKVRTQPKRRASKAHYYRVACGSFGLVQT
jgi:hypothetical protein